MSVSLATARTAVARRAQEFVAGTASGGSTTTIADTTNLPYVDGYWDETTALMTSGTNNGLVRRIQTFTSSTATLTLYQALTAGVASGDTYELYRRFIPVDVLTAINRAINIGSPDFRERVRVTATATADTLTYLFPTGPALFDRNLVSIEYQVYTLAAQSDWPYQKLSPDQYEITERWDGSTNAKTLQLRFNPMTNRLIRFVFDGPLGNVSADTDLIRLDLPELEWLYTQAAAELWRIEASRTTDVNRKDALEELGRWEANADKLRRQLAPQQADKPLRRTRFRVLRTGL